MLPLNGSVGFTFFSSFDPLFSCVSLAGCGIEARWRLSEGRIYRVGDLCAGAGRSLTEKRAISSSASLGLADYS
jgi:hypothetical protein